MIKSIQRTAKIILCGAVLSPAPAFRAPAASAAVSTATVSGDFSGDRLWNTRSHGDGVHSLSAIADELARAPQKILTPARVDGINDAAVFGANAAEVSIYRLRGRMVFHASQHGGAPIVWNCRDAAGRVDEAGVYIARIRKADSGILYQSFVLAK